MPGKWGVFGPTKWVRLCMFFWLYRGLLDHRLVLSLGFFFFFCFHITSSVRELDAQIKAIHSVGTAARFAQASVVCGVRTAQ